MIQQLLSIYNNATLYGHALTSLPRTICSSIQTYPTFTYTKPDPGRSNRVGMIFEHYISTKNHTDGTQTITYGTNALPVVYAEQAMRYTIRYSLLLVSYTAALPLGFAIKILHALGKELSRRLPFQ